jgi:hypothetical protein
VNQAQGDKKIGKKCQFLKSSQKMPKHRAKDQIESPKHQHQTTFKTFKSFL